MKPKLILFLPIFFLLFSCKNKSEQLTSKKELFQHQNATQMQQYINQVKLKKNDALQNFFNSLPLEQKIAQIFIVGVEGSKTFKPLENLGQITSSNDTTALIPGGVILFAFNLSKEPEDVMEFTASFRQYCKKNNLIPPFLSTDQEGGYVNRLKDLCGPFPSSEFVSNHFTLEQAYTLYSLQAQQMKLLGLDLNLAPVMEICTEDNKYFLDERSFGSYNQVMDYGKEFVNAFMHNGIDVVLKHFPGNTNTDPHTGLPEILLSMPELQKSYQAFIDILELNPAGILMSHARTIALDENVPACLSYEWVTQVLRNKYNYQGIIFSDDIHMAALSKNGYPPEKAVVMAVDAGITSIMISKRHFAKFAKVLYDKASIDASFKAKIEQSCLKILNYKLNAGILKYEEQGIDYKIDSVAKDGILQNMELFEELKNKNIELYKDISKNLSF